VVCIFASYSLKNKAYNYAVMNVWHFVTVFIVLWFALMNLLDYTTGLTLITLIMFSVGALIMIIVGIIVMKKKCVAFLYFEKHKDLQGLFRFAFRFNERMPSTHLFRSMNIYSGDVKGLGDSDSFKIHSIEFDQRSRHSGA
jgi:hypothetical protein